MAVLRCPFRVVPREPLSGLREGRADGWDFFPRGTLRVRGWFENPALRQNLEVVIVCPRGHGAFLAPPLPLPDCDCVGGILWELFFIGKKRPQVSGISGVFEVFGFGKGYRKWF